MDHDACNKCPICDDCHDCKDFSDCSEYTLFANEHFGIYRNPRKDGCLVFLNRRLTRAELMQLKDLDLNVHPKFVPVEFLSLLNAAGLDVVGNHSYFTCDCGGVMAISLASPDIPISCWINEKQHRFAVDNYSRYCALTHLGKAKFHDDWLEAVTARYVFEHDTADQRGATARTNAKRQQRRKEARAILKAFKALP